MRRIKNGVLPNTVYWDTSSKGDGRRHAIWRLDATLPCGTRIRVRRANRNELLVLAANINLEAEHYRKQKELNPDLVFKSQYVDAARVPSVLHEGKFG